MREEKEQKWLFTPPAISLRLAGIYRWIMFNMEHGLREWGSACTLICIQAKLFLFQISAVRKFFFSFGIRAIAAIDYEIWSSNTKHQVTFFFLAEYSILTFATLLFDFQYSCMVLSWSRQCKMDYWANMTADGHGHAVSFFKQLVGTNKFARKYSFVF